MGTLLPGLVRGVVVATAYVVYLLLAPTIWGADKGGGANIGAGLFAFAGAAIIAGLWAAIDGRHHGSHLAGTRWAIGIPVAATLMVLIPWLTGQSDLVAAELPSLGIFLAVVMAVPALVGVIVGSLIVKDRAATDRGGSRRASHRH